MKKIDYSLGFIEADGRKFYISESLSVERFMEYERLQNSMGFNLTFKQIFDKLNEIYSLLNGNKILDGGIKVYNLMNGIAERVDNKIHPALEVCALFLNEENEDTASYNKEVIKSKIDAWKKEGYDMQDFFSLAISLVQGFTTAYEDFMENISKLVAVKE